MPQPIQLSFSPYLTGLSEKQQLCAHKHRPRWPFSDGEQRRKGLPATEDLGGLSEAVNYFRLRTSKRCFLLDHSPGRRGCGDTRQNGERGQLERARRISQGARGTLRQQYKIWGCDLEKEARLEAWECETRHALGREGFRSVL